MTHKTAFTIIRHMTFKLCYQLIFLDHYAAISVLAIHLFFHRNNICFGSKQMFQCCRHPCPDDDNTEIS